jgi:hypothetical protein
VWCSRGGAHGWRTRRTGTASRCTRWAGPDDGPGRPYPLCSRPRPTRPDCSAYASKGP